MSGNTLLKIVYVHSVKEIVSLIKEIEIVIRGILYRLYYQIWIIINNVAQMQLCVTQYEGLL